MGYFRKLLHIAEKARIFTVCAKISGESAVMKFPWLVEVNLQFFMQCCEDAENQRKILQIFAVHIEQETAL